jgi:pimeloyl-ACP methyl ester carboxylesterase
MKTQISGTEIAYDDVGSGSALLWLHGYPLNRSLWASQVAALGGWRHIVPDLRGFGETPASDKPCSMDTFADDAAALLDKLGIERAVVAGLSMGGYIAMAFARRHGRRMQALVLADTKAGADTSDAAAQRRKNAEKALAEGVGTVVDPMVEKLLSPSTLQAKPAVVTRLKEIMRSASPRGVASALVAMAERPDSTESLAKVSVPSLVIVGRDDTLTPPAESQRISSAIPGARLVEIPDAGHLPNLEQPDAFNSAVRTFLNSI